MTVEKLREMDRLRAELAASIAREGEQGKALIAVKCELVRVRGVLREVLAVECFEDEEGKRWGRLALTDDLRARAEAEVPK